MPDIFVQTFTGRRVSLIDPQPFDIDILDIAHALSMQCRFNGHTDRFYSVADHSVLVSKIVNQNFALPALLHDAPEAYCGDVISPMKAVMLSSASDEFCRCEERLWMAICVKFAMDPDECCEVNRADRIALATEKRDLLRYSMDWETKLPDPHPTKIMPLSQAQAEDAFLDRFCEVTKDEVVSRLWAHRRRA